MTVLKNIVLCSLLMALPVSVWAVSQDDAYNKALEYAQSIHEDGVNKAFKNKPKDVPGFTTDNPMESGLIDTDLGLAGQDAIDDGNEGAQAIIASFNERPAFTIDDNDPALVRGEEIIEDAQDMLGGTSPCQTLPPLCETTTTYHTCEVGNTLDPVTCIQTLNVIPGETQQDSQTLVLTVKAGRTVWVIGPNNTWPAEVVTFWVDLGSGKLLYTSGAIDTWNGSTVSVAPTYQTGGCDTLSASASSSATLTQAPTCDNLVMKFSVTLPAGFAYFTTTVTVQLKTETRTPHQDNWQDNCNTLTAQPTCNLTEAALCIEGPQTRTIDGVAITRDCWAKQLTYTCGESIDTCAGLREQGCEQVGATCQQGSADSCGITTQTYRCEQTQCVPDESATCGGEIFCVDGNCNDSDEAVDEDFNEVVSVLSTISQGISGMEADMRIYNGDAMSCSEIPIGFKNCCADRGWGLDLSLASCNTEEKQLGEAKEKGLAVYVGRFCAERVLGVCIRYKRGHCVFDNTQAFLVQSQARSQQLGLSFGAAEFPVCTGLTPEQLTRIDFEKIDFSPLFAEIQAQIRLPDASNLVSNIELTLP